ncbi:hypothetical protein [Actinophytocola sp.]|uniref:hypothetical protein n=1 Tax=Actinophytocola sp. TaxID=1872138 RepID=UPI00389A6F13
MASKASKDVSDFTAVLHGHTGVINAIREDQLEHGKNLARIEKEMRAGFARVDEKFDKVDARFGKVETEMREGFGLLAEGQQRITELIIQHIEECDKG